MGKQTPGEEERLKEIIRLADNRSETFDAIGRLLQHHPTVAEGFLSGLLGNPTTTDRASAIVVFYLKEFELFPELVSAHIQRVEQLVASISRDVEQQEEEGIDPFSPRISR